MFEANARHDHRAVRVAAYMGLAHRGGDAAALEGIADRDPWVSQAAAGAFGERMNRATAKEVRAVADAADPALARHLVMALVAAGHTPTEADLDDPRPRVAAAWLPGAPKQIDRFAVAKEPARRTAAAMLLPEHLTAERARQFMASSDPVVRAAAYAAVLHEPGLPKLRVEALATLADDRDPMVWSEVRAFADVPPAPPRPEGIPGFEASQHIIGATLETTAGTVRVKLRPRLAPLHVASFAYLAESGQLDGLVMHRVVPGFVVQGGCPRNDGWGGPGYSLPDEFSPLPYTAGVLGMARADHDTAGSQWFITTSPQPHLDANYTAFGIVRSGMDVVQRMTEDDRVLSVRIERSR